MATIFHFRSYMNYLSRNKLYTAINIIGFSVSLMFVILLGCYSLQEFSTDRYHTNKDRIYRLTQHGWSNFPAPMGRDLQQRYPEIEEYTRFFGFRTPYREQERGGEARIMLVDPAFFRMFTTHALRGNPEQALARPDGLVLTESFARRLFGQDDPIEKSIDLYDSTYMVEAVIGDFPKSHFRTPDIIGAFETWFKQYGGEDVLTSYDYETFGLYLMGREGTDLRTLSGDLLEYFKSTYKPYILEINKRVDFEPLTDVYYGITKNFSICQSGSRLLVSVLSWVALLVLFFAVINYINLSMAQAGFRAKEMTMRRVLGSTRGEVILRLVMESTLLCAVSLLIGTLLALIAEPHFNELLNTHIGLVHFLHPRYLVYWVAAVVVLGTFSGLIPALVISRYRLLEVMQGRFQRHAKQVYGRILILVQYLITIVLIGCCITVYRQWMHMKEAPMGFSSENVLIVSLQNLSAEQREAFRREVSRIPDVQQLSMCYNNPYYDLSTYKGTYNNKPISWRVFVGDSAYLSLVGFEVLRTTGTQAPDAIWLNEAALQVFELPDTVSYFEFLERPVAGVVRDFIYQDFTRETAASFIFPMDEPQYAGQMLVKLSGRQNRCSYLTIRNLFDKLVDRQWEMEGRFAEKYIEDRFQEESRTTTLLSYMTGIALLIATLGMLAMALFFIQQRRPEIAIRQVFGSTREQTLGRTVIGFIRPVLISFLLAVPILWYVTREWLIRKEYVYRIEVGWDIYLLAGGIALLMAVLTVASLSWKAAHTNPVDTLKH